MARTRSTHTMRTASGMAYRPSKAGEPPWSYAPSRFARILTIVILAFVTIYFLFPLYWLIVNVTKDNADLVSSNGLLLADWNLGENYHALQEWTKGLFWRWVGNSFLYSTSAALIGTLVSTMAGYALAKYSFRGRNAIMVMVMGGLLMPVALLTVPLYLQFHYMGLTDTVASIIIPSCVSPFGVFLGRVYAQTSVPTELIEAARIDGAGEVRIFFTMALRLLAPAMVTIFLFIFVATWNNFLLPLMMISTDELQPITLGLYGMMSYFAPVKGAVMLGALLGVIPLIVLFLGLQRFWQAGLAAGAVKG